MSTATLQVLLLGDSRPLEMHRAFTSFERTLAGGIIEQVTNVEQAVSLIAAADWYPDLVIVFQSWPDQFGAAEVQELIGMLPLARWVCCFGAWCESDGRNKAIWPQSTRVPARIAEWRIYDELRVLTDRRNALPLTASRDEIFEFDHSEYVMDVSVDLPVCVISADAAFRLYLQDLLRAANCRIENSQNASAAGFVVWDADPWNKVTASQIQSFHVRNPEVRIIVLLDFAHPQDERRVKQHGVDAVVAKLTSATQLLAVIRELGPRSFRKSRR